MNNGWAIVFSKFSDDVHVGRTTSMLDTWIRIEKDLFKLEKWPEKKLAEIHGDHCSVVLLGRNN